MDSPAAIPAARLRHSKHLQLNRPTLTADVINASILVLSCHRPRPRPRLDTLDTGGRGWAVACLTTLYDIAISWSWYTGLQYRDTIFFSRYEPYMGDQPSRSGQCVTAGLAIGTRPSTICWPLQRPLLLDLSCHRHHNRCVHCVAALFLHRLLGWWR